MTKPAIQKSSSERRLFVEVATGSKPHRFDSRRWLKPPQPTTKPPHIIACLGWTQERVDKLRAADLLRHRAEQTTLHQILQRLQQGIAVALESPLERMSPIELKALVRPGQVMVVPWRIDLARLDAYGYSLEEIQGFEQRMYQLAAKRMRTLA